VFGNPVQHRFLTREGNGGGAGDSRTAGQVDDHVFRQFRTRTHQAHVSGKHVEDLRQFIEFEAAQKWTHRRKRLIIRSGNSVIAGLVVVHQGAEFEDREVAAVRSHPLLQEQDRPRGSQADDDRDKKKNRN